MKEFIVTTFSLSQNRIISREEERVATRLKAHADNNVWQRRDKPPAPREWANDLPDNLVAACERSKLASVYDEFGDPVSIDGSTVRTMNNLLPRCSIM